MFAYILLSNIYLGHHNTYKCRKVLHCDVSDDNTIFLVKTISAESAVSLWEPGADASLPRTVSHLFFDTSDIDIMKRKHFPLSPMPQC